MQTIGEDAARFYKEPKTFPQDILLILNLSVSVSRLLLRSKFPLSLLLSELSLLTPARPVHTRRSRVSLFPTIAASLRIIRLSPSIARPNYLSRLLSTASPIEGKRASHRRRIKKGREEREWRPVNHRARLIL